MLPFSTPWHLIAMFHCHVIDHMETGLMAAIEVS
ncbi:multicopper oxidase domain-containing protein [Pseudomonas sp. CCI2.4]